MSKTNAAEKVVSLRNPLKAYKELKAEIDALNAQFKAAREKILAKMDEAGADELKYGDYKATRKVIEQSRLDTKAAKEILGDDAPMVTSEQVRLTVL